MTNIIKFPSDKRADNGATQAENVWLGTPHYEGQMALANKERATAAELLEIEALGAGNHGPNPLNAPSWQPLMTVKRKSRTLREVLISVSETGHSYQDLNAWGIQCVNAGTERMELVFNLEADSKAGPLFLKAKVPQWRKALAHDAHGLKLERGRTRIYDFDHFVTAWARFTLPMNRKA